MPSPGRVTRSATFRTRPWWRRTRPCRPTRWRCSTAGRRRTPAQERLRRDYLDHLAAHPDGVAKAGPPAHVTASCIVLDPTGGRVLLTLHRRANAWFQFGGHLEVADPTAVGGGPPRGPRGVRHRHPRAAAPPGAARPAPARGVLRRLPRAPRPAVRRGGAGRGDRPRSVRSRTTCGGGRSTRCPRAPAPSSPRWCHSRATPSVSADPPSTGSTSSSPSGAQALGVGQPVEEAPGPLQARVRREQPPEARAVAGHEQVGELVEQHVVEHVVGHVAQPVGDPDGALGGRARGPAPAHRRHPAHAGRAGVAAEVAARELLGPRGQGRVGGLSGAGRRPSAGPASAPPSGPPRRR